MLTQAASMPSNLLVEGRDKTFKRILIVFIGIWLIAFFVDFTTAINIIGFFAFIGLIFGIKYRLWGLFSLFLLVILDPLLRVFVLQGGLLRWNTLNYWLLIITIVNIRTISRNWYHGLKFYFVWLLILLFQLSYSQNLLFGSQSLLYILSFFGLYIYVTKCFDSDLNNMLYRSALFFGSVSAIVGFFFYRYYGLRVFDTTYLNNLGFSSNSLVINPNAFSFTFKLAVMLLCIYFSKLKNKKDKLLFAVMIVLNATWIFMSGSRGGILLCIVSFIFIIEKVNFKKIITYGLLCLIVFQLLKPVILNSENFTMQRIALLINEDIKVSKRTSGRSELYKVGWQMFQMYPFGIGTGSFKSGLAKYATFNEKYIDNTKYKSGVAAHSAYIMTIVENGIIGLLPLILFLISFAWTGYRFQDLWLNKLGLYATTTTLISFLSNEFQGKSTWLFIAITCYIFFIYSNTNNKGTEDVAIDNAKKNHQ